MDNATRQADVRNLGSTVSHRCVQGHEYGSGGLYSAVCSEITASVTDWEPDWDGCTGELMPQQ